MDDDGGNLGLKALHDPAAGANSMFAEKCHRVVNNGVSIFGRLNEHGSAANSLKFAHVNDANLVGRAGEERDE